LSVLRHLRFLHSPELGQSARDGTRTRHSLWSILETPAAAALSTLHHRAGVLPAAHRVVREDRFHALLLLRPRHASIDAAQSRSAHVLHDQRRLLDAGDRRATVSRLFSVAVSARALGLGRDARDRTGRAFRVDVVQSYCLGEIPYRNSRAG